MQVMFRSGQELVKVGEIGESIVEADCAFRLEIVRAVLAELRSDWEKLPLRNATGLKYPARGLSAVKQSMHERAMRCAESMAYAKNLKVDTKIDALGIELKCLKHKEDRGGIAGPSMQVDIHGVQSRMKALQLLKAHHLQEAQEEALGKAADNIDAFVRDEYVRVSELAAWLRAEHGFDCQSYVAAEDMAASSTSTDGEIAQMLTGWFDSPIDDLPPKPREIAEAYIPSWPELSGADRRARADEADRQLQAKLGARFSIPDAFRQTVTKSAPTTNTAPQVLDEAQEQTAPSGTSEKAAPEVVVLRKRSALIAQFSGMWPTIERDLRDAGRNGLTNAAHAEKHGFWKVREALKWAAEQGKIKQDKAERFICTEGESEISVLVRAMLNQARN